MGRLEPLWAPDPLLQMLLMCLCALCYASGSSPQRPWEPYRRAAGPRRGQVRVQRPYETHRDMMIRRIELIWIPAAHVGIPRTTRTGDTPQHGSRLPACRSTHVGSRCSRGASLWLRMKVGDLHGPGQAAPGAPLQVCLPCPDAVDASVGRLCCACDRSFRQSAGPMRPKKLVTTPPGVVALC